VAGARLINWSRPWLAEFAPLRALLESDDPREALTRAAREAGVCTRGGRPVSFVDGGDAGGADYELHIAATGRVPTRPLAHDLFNAAAWLAYPRIKAGLNALHCAARGPAGPTSARGPVRDAATLLDENGVLYACADAVLAEDLRAMRWRRIFVEARERFEASVRVLVLGHALLDKLQCPYKGICAHAWIVPVEPQALRADGRSLRARLDRDAAAALAAGLDAGCAGASKVGLSGPGDLQPLPVLGIPGWWPANLDPAFYDDPQVFRTARAARRGLPSPMCGRRPG
jgi:hypothetical protein